MEMSSEGSSQRRRSKPSSRSGDLGVPASQSNAHLGTADASLVGRLQLNWQSLPARKEARLYTPSAGQVLHGENNRTSGPAKVSSKTASSPFEHLKTAGMSARKLSQRISSNVAAFEQKYAAEDVLMRYVLHVIRTGSSVRRSDIPRVKSTQRKVRPEEDVLYLVHCAAPPCGFRNMYWLTFADEGTILRSDQVSSLGYFTLGSRGFTRFKGGQGIEFSDLANWVDEKRAFDHMANMKGLERIQQMIFFFSWKRRAVQRRLHRVQKRLACSLFTCHPVAAHLLIAVRDVCGEIEREAGIGYVQGGTSYSLECLVRIHQDRARAAKTAIAKKIHGLCFTIDNATRDISHYKEESTYVITDQEAFSKSLRISSLRDRMFTFLRLVDFHVAEAVYEHITIIVQDLRTQMYGNPAEEQSPSVMINRNDVHSTYTNRKVDERSGHLCESVLAEVVSKTSSPGEFPQLVNYRVYTFGSDTSVVAFPGLYVRLFEGVDFGGDVSSATMNISPTKVEVLELVHTILLRYCVAMDALPRVLTDKNFEHVLTPFVPLVKRDFVGGMLKPSLLVLDSCKRELCEMRAALEKHYRRIGILQQEHLRCIRAIKIAERDSPVESAKRRVTTDLDDSEKVDARLPELPDLSNSAAAYELAQKTWNRFVQYADSAAPVLQVGYLLLDQRSFVKKLRVHVSKRVAELDNDLPSIYQQFLMGLLEDVDGRIEQVTKIPTNLAEANIWLTQVTSMMTTHPFRQRLNTKIANLARLRALIKERGLISFDLEVQDTTRKLELTWESVIDTLFMCLARVEERGSEHRRSVQDVITKVDEYINGQLQLILTTFEELPSGCEEDNFSSGTAMEDDDSKREGMVQQLEDLVAMDLERKNVVQQFEEYDREHRAITDMPQRTVWTPSSSENASATTLTDKLPSELLLLYIITSLELREWYDSWKKLRDKWLGSPLTGVHPGTMINRIKQFRRRLGQASSRLTRLSSALLQTLPLESSAQHQHYSQGHEDEDRKTYPTFTRKDFEIMRIFDESIEEMLNCNRVFQAISGGAFSEARWAAMHQLLNVQSGSIGVGGLTLRAMKQKCGARQIEEFLEVCDECIVEAKFHIKMEQARQRLARIEVRVEETNYSVRCEGLPEALAQLDDIAVDLKLCLFGQNPELQICLELRNELERKVSVCKHILAYQKDWRLRCEATKLHEVDEFFSKRFSGGGGDDIGIPRLRKSQQKTGLKQEQTVWKTFLDTSHAWSDRLRRLFFVFPRRLQAEQGKTNRIISLGTKATAPSESAPPLSRRMSIATKSMGCTLDDVMKNFEGFDFEATFSACERGMELIHTYIASLREKTPRMYCLDEEMMLRLLLRDSDIQQLHQSLAICFPRVHRFAISRAANRIGSTFETFEQESAPLLATRASKTDGTIVIVGLEGVQDDFAESQKCVRFRLPVAKIGRVKFWFTRLEEEMSSMVLSDLKRALEWASHDYSSPAFIEYDSLLPQSIFTAFGLRFTFEMNRALREIEIPAKLHQLQLMINERLEGLVSKRRTDKATSSSIRLENIIFLSVMQSDIVRHVSELSEQGRDEDSLFFWSTQFQTRVYVETILPPGTVIQPSPGKHNRVERSELLPTSSDSMKIPESNHSGQSVSMSVFCQVAHLQLPLGQEFVGWERLAILSPFTQRCSYALFSALKMHHTALVVPYSANQRGTDPTSLIWGIGQLLMRPCIEFSCNSSAGVTTILNLGNLISAVSRLNGFLVIRHLLQLSAALIGSVQQRMLQHFHHVNTVGSHGLYHQQAVTNSLVLPRQHGGLHYGASAIFLPLTSAEDLHRSGLTQSIRTKFRAVAVTRPVIQYIVQCFLITDGYTLQQIQELNVVQAFEAVDALEIGPVLVPRVVQESRRLRAFYRVVWDPHPLTTGGNALKTGRMEICEGQCIFRQAFIATINILSLKEQASDTICQHANLLLMRVFPLSEGGKLVTKAKGGEEAVAAAVTMYLESVHGLSAAFKQFELVMELWRALQTFPAALVCGPPGCGKSTCITALHRALVALELSERSQENEEGGGRNTQSKPQSSLSQLVILNPQLLTLEQFYNSIAAACGGEHTRKAAGSNALKWILVDGEVDGAVLDRLLEGENRACSSASTLPSSSILYRGQRSSVLSGDCTDPDSSPRLLFEVTSVVSLSPSALAKCWALHVPSHCIGVASIIGAWQTRWQNQLVFSPESRGAGAMVIVFKAVDVLISSICVQFAVEEATGYPIGEELERASVRLGCLSLNHITLTALKLVTLCCFRNKSLLQELSYLRLVELVAFSVLWGFAGHLADPFKHKLESYVRVKSKEYSETKHLTELPRGLMDANHFEDVWSELQPGIVSQLSLQPTNDLNRGTKPETKMQSAFDALSGQVLVLIPAAISLIRICTVLLHTSHSFLLIGPAASGKTSLLRWIKHRNNETEIAGMKIETSLDERHVHGILDWMGMPAAWFQPLSERNSAADSRAKLREEAELFAGRAKHSFIFLDDLDASGTSANTTQVEFVRTMLDHRLGYNTKKAGFQIVEKQVGASMRLNDSEPVQNLSPMLARFLRHFSVFRMPTYSHKELLSVFRVKYQQHFKVEVSRVNTERRLSAKGTMGGSGQQLTLEDVILRASIDLAVELASFQQLGNADHPCLFLFNLHHVDMLLERTLVFASSVSASRKCDSNQITAGEGTTLVMLGKAHQSWFSELQNIFLSNCPAESSPTGLLAAKTSEPVEDRQDKRVLVSNGDDTQKKMSLLLRRLSEKYFSVALRGSGGHNISISVEALHFLIKLAERHVQAPLLQPRLAQLRELLNEHMTAANGISRRSSDQARGASSANNGAPSPVELVSGVLLEIAAASSRFYSKSNRPYSSGQLPAVEMKLLLSSSWCLTQATHLVHALSQQQMVVVSSAPECSKLLSDRLLRFACDLHDFKVHLVEVQDDNVELMAEQHKNVLRIVLGAAGVRQERVALWVRQHQLVLKTNVCNPDTKCLANILQELCLGEFPSLALLPGGEELRQELLLSCIQSRKQLEMVTEAEIMFEFQQRLRDNFRLCIFEESGESGHEAEARKTSLGQVLSLIGWMKTRPSCHWRRLNFSEFDLQHVIPEMAKAALASPALCGVAWDLQQIAKYTVLCHKVHMHMMTASSVAVEPASQLNYFLSFLTNVTVSYGAKLHCRQQRMKHLETALETLVFARDKVVPTLKRMQQTFELQSTHNDSELEVIIRELELEKKHSSTFQPIEENLPPEQEEARWALHSRYEELMLTNSETQLRLDDVSRYLAEWCHVADRIGELSAKWTRKLDQEKSKTEQNILAAVIYASAQRAYTHVTALPGEKRMACIQLLHNVIIENFNIDSSSPIKVLADAHTDADSTDASAEITKLIWISRFPFLDNPNIYRDIRLVDDMCDRVPVVVDPSGVMQRFLVHVFSGHTVFSTFPGCGTTGEVERDYPSTSKESMIISCDDPKFESQLHDAQRLKVPILLVNFRSADNDLLSRLQPFLDHNRLSHAPPRRPMLRELTMKYYENQRKQKQKRTSVTGSAIAAMPSLVQTAGTVGGGVALKFRRATKARLTVKNKMVIADAAAVAATVAANLTLKPMGNDLGNFPERRAARASNGANNGSISSSRCFQIYAVTATPVSLQLQHDLASQFAHFAMSLPEAELNSMLQTSRVGKCQPKLLQELRGEQIRLTDCWVKMIQRRDRLCQQFEGQKPANVRDESPFASRITSTTITIQLLERYSELATQLSNEHQAELVADSREKSLREKYAELTHAIKIFAPMATRLVGVTRCLTAMSSLSIGNRTSPFYLQNVCYVEMAVSQQIDVQGGGGVQLSATSMSAIMSRVAAGFVSDSHRHVFSSLDSLQQQVQRIRFTTNDGLPLAAWIEAVVWLVASSVRRRELNDAASLDFDTSAEIRQGIEMLPGHRKSLRWPDEAGTSLVERLRRRVKLCGYLFNGWKASQGRNNVRGKQAKAPRPLRHVSTTVNPQLPSMNIGDTDTSNPDSFENDEIVVEKLQQKLDSLLSTSEIFWYEWKTYRVRLQLDVERILSNLGYQGASTSSPGERSNTLFPSLTVLISLENLVARFRLETVQSTLGDEPGTRQQSLVSLLLAKTFFPTYFAQALYHYLLQRNTFSTYSENLLEPGLQKNDERATTEDIWTAWPSPASLVVDISPSRGKHSRVHLPRALIMYMPGQRTNVELHLSPWDIAVFVESDTENAVREELTMLITTKHRFVLEVLDAKHAESALTLVSQLINEHALLSVPEWYLLASFAVATAIESAKFTVMDRIAVYSSENQWHLNFVDCGRGNSRSLEQTIKHKLVNDCGALDSVASGMTLAVLNNHAQDDEDKGSARRDLEDLILHHIAIEEVAVDNAEREQMVHRLIRLLSETNNHNGSGTPRKTATRDAILSSELLSDLVSIGDSSLALLVDEPGDDWLSRCSSSGGEAARERLWTTLCQVSDLFEALQATSKLPSDQNIDTSAIAKFFPWRPFDIELANQLSAVEVIHKHLRALGSPSRVTSNCQQQLSSLARGYLPFEWTESYFAGTAWPSHLSGAVSVAQMLLLVACRVGVLVRCLRGDRAWALNLAVVSDACQFLRCLRTYTANRSGLSESSLVLILELDSSAEATETSTATSDGEKMKRKILAIAKQLGAKSGGDTQEPEHGAVLYHIENGIESWGIRVEGLVLIQHGCSTKLHPLPMCRITCQPRMETTSLVEASMVLLPSMSPYQPVPTMTHEPGTQEAVHLVLGRTINSVVDTRDNSTTREVMQFGVGVPLFPDDDSSEGS